MPTLAIIIVNYNTHDLLQHCLKSVYANRTGSRYHVIVVDNPSSDGSAELVAARYPQATLITSDRNGGFGYANNLALRWLAARQELPSKGSHGSIPARGPTQGDQPHEEVPEL